jgi:nicotinate-nucleotide adenylyltransferase
MLKSVRVSAKYCLFMMSLENTTDNDENSLSSRRVAFYGGSFDPIHRGHLMIAEKLSGLFGLERFVFVPAFHAPHKRDKKPTSAFHRYAMLCLATNDEPKISVSKMELDVPERPYTVETQSKLKAELGETRIFFVIGADSWQDITSWREWETVLTLTNIIVVTRPGYEIATSHVTDIVRARIVDLRDFNENQIARLLDETAEDKIYLTDAVQMDISATEIRRKFREKAADWNADILPEVAKHIEKYQIY